MDFHTLPDYAFLKIFNFLPLEDQARAGRVNTAFRRISTFVLSHTEELDLADDIFCDITAFCLSKLINLCSGTLERIVIPFEHKDGRSLATVFVKECCPRLRNVTVYNAGNDSLSKMIRNSPNVQNLYWGPTGNFIDFPQFAKCENLSTLDCSCMDASFRSLVGRVPNLRQFKTFAVVNHGGLMDKFFGTTPKLENLDVQFSRNNVDFNDMTHFWQLKSLTTLRISYESVVACPFLPNDDVLKNIAVSFPKLRVLELLCVGVSMAGVEALGGLQELCDLVLYGINAQDLDAAVERLSECRRLKKLQISGALVTSTTLLTLLYSCPDLAVLSLREIVGINNPNSAVTILKSCAGLQRRYVNIALCTPDQFAYAVWESKLVEKALVKLKDHGPVIKISRGY